MSNQSLNMSYTYSDPDLDSEKGSNIKWFKNDIEQIELNGSKIVPHSMTSKGEQWKYLIVPSDGTDFGEPREFSMLGHVRDKCPNLFAFNIG